MVVQFVLSVSILWVGSTLFQELAGHCKLSSFLLIFPFVLFNVFYTFSFCIFFAATDARAAPICLPDKNEDFLGKFGWAAGWGALNPGSRLRPKTLQAVDVPVIENRYVKRKMKFCCGCFMCLIQRRLFRFFCSV